MRRPIITHHRDDYTANTPHKFKNFSFIFSLDNGVIYRCKNVCSLYWTRLHRLLKNLNGTNSEQFQKFLMTHNYPIYFFISGRSVSTNFGPLCRRTSVRWYQYWGGFACLYVWKLTRFVQFLHHTSTFLFTINLFCYCVPLKSPVSKLGLAYADLLLPVSVLGYRELKNLRTLQKMINVSKATVAFVCEISGMISFSPVAKPQIFGEPCNTVRTICFAVPLRCAL